MKKMKNKMPADESVNTNELRLGNQVLWEGGYEYVKGINQYSVCISLYKNARMAYGHWELPNNIKPIPVDAQWAKNVGLKKPERMGASPFDYWEKEDGSFWIRFYKNGRIDFGINQLYRWNYYPGPNRYRPQYAHQLQNLYYAITNKELL